VELETFCSVNGAANFQSSSHRQHARCTLMAANLQHLAPPRIFSGEKEAKSPLQFLNPSSLHLFTDLLLIKSIHPELIRKNPPPPPFAPQLPPSVNSVSAADNK